MKKIIVLVLILFPKLILSQWEPTSWDSDMVLQNIYINENIIIYAKSYGGIVISIDKGKTWKTIDESNMDIVPNTILVKGNNIFIGGFGFLYVSTDLGETWQSKINGMQSFPIVNSLVNIGNKIFAGSAGGVFISTDNGENWTVKNNGFGKYLTVFKMINSGDKLLVSNQSGIFLSTDLGESWIQKNKGLPEYYTYDKLSLVDSLILIGSNVDIYNGGINKIFITTDYCESWIEKNNQPFYKSYTYSFASIDNRIFLSSKDSLFVSLDSAESWFNVTNNLPIQLQQGIDEFFVDGENIYASSGSELYLSSDKGNSWIAIRKVNNYGVVNTLVTKNKTIFVGTSPTKKMTTYPNGIFSSTDYGNTWEPRGLIHKDVLALYTYHSNIYAITNRGNFLSTNIGDTWLENGIGFPDSSEIWSMAFNSKGIFAACGREGIKLSSDEGKSWINQNNGLPIPRQSVISLKIKDNTIFAGLDSSFYISTDNGETWHEKNKGLPSSDLMIWQIEIYNNNLYIVAKLGIYNSSNFGENWNLISKGLPNWDYGNYKDYYNCKIKIINGNILAAINSLGGGIYLSTNNGENWTSNSNGITNIDLAISSLIEVGNFCFIGTNSGRFGEKGDGIFRSRIDELITNIVGFYEDKGNYFTISPNPSNENATLLINLEKQSKVSISIYNNLGIEIIRILDNQNYEKGLNKFNFYSKDLPSGVYYCLLKTDYYKTTIKFIVIH